MNLVMLLLCFLEVLASASLIRVVGARLTLLVLRMDIYMIE